MIENVLRRSTELHLEAPAFRHGLIIPQIRLLVKPGLLRLDMPCLAYHSRSWTGGDRHRAVPQPLAARQLHT